MKVEFVKLNISFDDGKTWKQITCAVDVFGTREKLEDVLSASLTRRLCSEVVITVSLHS